jgi:hypothetical protein
MTPPLLSPTATRAVGEDGARLSRPDLASWRWVAPVVAERGGRVGLCSGRADSLWRRAVVTVVSVADGRVARGGG